MTRGVVVLDVGKTISKLTLWTPDGSLLARRTRPNGGVPASGYTALDQPGIQAWLIDVLSEFAGLADVARIIPVAHGAAAAFVRDGALATPPVDYEFPVPANVRGRYNQDRDSFALTGSPALPQGLNLGAQFALLESLDCNLEGTQLLLWPQYWAWVLSGVAASEVTSLGTHTDLWRPVEKQPSGLAKKRGWDKLLPPMRGAGDALGRVRPEIAKRTGLAPTTLVHCGIHDLNAALIAVRAFPEVGERESTVLSTGTWFVAMRTLGPGTALDIAALPEHRDCLVNVDAFGRAVPSSRFMGGREIETLLGGMAQIDVAEDQAALVAALPRVLAQGAMVLPTFAKGFGPFPQGQGRWTKTPADPVERRAAICLYAALVSDAELDLIGARERIVIEGRFAAAQAFARALATLRPQTTVYVVSTQIDVSFGALRLVDPTLKPSSTLTKAEPLGIDLAGYRERWRSETQRTESAA